MSNSPTSVAAAGQIPGVPPVPPTWPPGVWALIQAQDTCWAQGEPFVIEERLTALSEEERKLALPHLIVNEMKHRRQRGQEPTLDEYLVRFEGMDEQQRRVLFEPPTADERPGAEHKPPLPCYILFELLGRGTTGFVYRALNIDKGCFVALKLATRSTEESAELQERFRQEWRALAELKNAPHVVKVNRVSSCGEPLFIEMELVEGDNLAETIKKEQWPPRKTAEFVATLADAVQSCHGKGIIHRDLKPSNVMVEMVERHRQPKAEFVATLADAVQSCHEMGIIHRDLKPGNVMVDRHPQPKIMDFSLGKDLDAEEELTKTGVGGGTVGYTSPEQLESLRNAGISSDIYSLIVILYEMLTGVKPYERRESEGVLAFGQRIEHEPLVLPSRRNPAVHRDLDVICQRGLAELKDRRRWVPTAAHLASYLRQYLQHEPSPLRSVSLRELAWKWCRRKPARAVAYGLTVLVVSLVIGLVVGAVVQAELRREKEATKTGWEQAVIAKNEEEKQRKIAEAAKAKADRIKYILRIQRADAEMRAGNFHIADQELKDCDAPYRHWEWRYLRNRCPSFEKMRLPRDDVAVQLVNGEELLGVVGLDGWIKSFYQLEIWNIRTGTRLCELVGHTDQVNSVAFSADGQRIVSGSADNTVRIWDVRAGKQLFQLKGHTGAMISVAFSADGQRIVSGSADNTVRIWDVRAGEQLLALDCGERIHSLAISADGQWIVFCGPRAARVWSPRAEIIR